MNSDRPIGPTLGGVAEISCQHRTVSRGEEGDAATRDLEASHLRSMVKDELMADERIPDRKAVVEVGGVGDDLGVELGAVRAVDRCLPITFQTQVLDQSVGNHGVEMEAIAVVHAPRDRSMGIIAAAEHDDFSRAELVLGHERVRAHERSSFFFDYIPLMI